MSLFDADADVGDAALAKREALMSSALRFSDFSDESLSSGKYAIVDGQAIYHRDSDNAVVVVAYHMYAHGCALYATATTTG